VLPIISNTEVLAVNAAWAGAPGTRIAGNASANTTWTPCGWLPECSVPVWEVWSKPLPGGSAAVLFLNHGAVGSSADVPVTWAGVPGLGACGTGGCAVRDVYGHRDLGRFTGGFVASALAAHDSVFITVSP
jgi:hypothetical protein